LPKLLDRKPEEEDLKYDINTRRTSFSSFYNNEEKSPIPLTIEEHLE